jgi:hypothetical protein
MPPAAEAGTDAPPRFLPARPITPADLAALTERVCRRTIRWFRLTRLLDAAAAVDMLAWENSGFSVDASVRITLIDRDVPSYFRSLEHLLRYCDRPPFALERLSVIRGPGGRIVRIRYVLPRHKAATWVGPGRSRKSTRPGANGVVELSPFLSSSTGSLTSCPRRGSTGTGITGCSPRITSSGPPSPPSRSGMSASGAMPRLMGMRSADMRRAEMPPPTAATHATNRPPTTPPGLRGRNSWPGWGRSFRSSARGEAATSDSSRS